MKERDRETEGERESERERERERYGNVLNVFHFGGEIGTTEVLGMTYVNY